MGTTKPSLPMSGGCSCGAIRYEIKSFPLLLYSCNCTNCQRASGSAFALNMPVATKGFRIVKGEPKGWPHLSPSGAEVTTWFCGDCGGRINGSRKSRPDIVTIPAGMLDDTGWLTPVAHMFLKSAQPWVKSADGAECFDENPPDYIPLAKAWRALRPEFFPPK
jgi:hypothetical protein